MSQLDDLRRRYKRLFDSIKISLSPSRSSRHGVRPDLVVIHTTESGPGSLWGVVNYFRNAGTEVSSTYVVNDIPRADGWVDVVMCVPEAEKPWTQKSANAHAISYELVGRAARTSEEWLDHMAQLKTVAALVAEDCLQYGIPVKHAFPGILGHRDLTKAGFPNDHRDPGDDFPWTLFLKMVREFRDGVVAKPPVEKKNVAGQKRPAGIPARIPKWAWALREWHLGGRKGQPPKRPLPLPKWYWRWYEWSTATRPHGSKIN